MTTLKILIFHLLIIFLKKMKKQQTILFQYFWRFLHQINLTNHYIDFVFDKVYFEEDLSHLNEILNNSNFDLYFIHYLFPHSPMALDINASGECAFNKNNTYNHTFKNRNEWLSQHYKEIICTYKYLASFFSKLQNSKVLNDLDVLILSDTGLQIWLNKDKKTFTQDAHSVVFALKAKNVDTKHSKTLISSQELFSKYFNKSHVEANNVQKEFKVFDISKNNFIKIDKFKN